MQMCPSPSKKISWASNTYPPLSVGVRPKRVHSPTDMSRELSTVTTAASAKPHFDFTMSIFPAERDLGVITDSKMNRGRQREVTGGRANRTLLCIHRCISGRAREVILPLYTILVRPQREYCIQVWAPHFRRDVDNMERVQRRPPV
uniref:Uncharacterized protein n=1 Tax=Crocodylus porosus TaxID=8502 RepID=A0A7M4E0K4_CROPO